MDIAMIVVASFLMLLGILGSVLPVLPGPPISYLGLLIIHLTTKVAFSTQFLILFAILTISVIIIDYWIPIYGSKKLGASRYGIWGSTIGLILGIFLFPPFGIILGPFLGAFIGELVSGKSSGQSLKAGLGSFLGFLTGTFMKLSLCLVMAYYFIEAIFF